jgi:hypothetical protein
MMCLKDRLLALMARNVLNLSREQLLFYLPEISPREIDKCLTKMIQDGLVIVLLDRYMLTVKGIKLAKANEQSR